MKTVKVTAVEMVTAVTAVEMVTALCELGSPNRVHAKALLRSLIAREDTARLQMVARVAIDRRNRLQAAKDAITARQNARKLAGE
jgi:hypothetical protein